MLLSAIQPYIVGIIVAIVTAQYALAVFCLLKLAYIDVSKRNYILWNILILIVPFIGGAIFLVWYFRHPERKLPPANDRPPAELYEDGAEPLTEEEVKAEIAAIEREEKEEQSEE